MQSIEFIGADQRQRGAVHDGEDGNDGTRDEQQCADDGVPAGNDSVGVDRCVAGIVGDAHSESEEVVGASRAGVLGDAVDLRVVRGEQLVSYDTRDA